MDVNTLQILLSAAGLGVTMICIAVTAVWALQRHIDTAVSRMGEYLKKELQDLKEEIETMKSRENDRQKEVLELQYHVGLKQTLSTMGSRATPTPRSGVFAVEE